jgi:hypothetical protein
MRFERKGSGAILWVGDEAVKASSAGRECSMSALEKRLGEFEPRADERSPDPPRRAPQPIDPVSKPWKEYIAQRDHHDAERAAARDRLAERQRDEKQRTAERHRSEREDIFSRSWRGERDLLNATRSVLAAQQAQEKAELRDRQKLERDGLRREQRFPSFKEWLAERSPELAQEWRYRERQPAVIEGPKFDPPATRDIRAFEAVVDGGRVHYHLTGERGSPAFTDRGKVIDIRDTTRRENVLAALQLSAQKWGTFTVHGSEPFKRLCAELAAEHGFKIANPELQQAIVADRERVRLKTEPWPAQNARPSSLAEAYRLQLADARQGVPDNADPSRLDAEVAVRLRVAGHSPDAIARAIREGAPAMRPNEQRDWDAYARRAANFAFSVPGSQLAAHLEPQRARLIGVERLYHRELDARPDESRRLGRSR